MDRLTNPRSSLPVDDPEPIGLPIKTKAKDEQTDTKIVKESPVLTDVVLRTQKALGTNWKSPVGQIIVTDESLKEAASKEPNPPFRLVINPNDNIANLLDADGMQVESFAVGTGDTTGVRYGKKYFTPTGTSEIINKVPYDQVEGSYGPMWMGLDWDHYGLHGPHKRDDIESSGEGFENKGFVSHGCMRFMEKDIMKLSEYLEVGSSVEVLPYDTRPNIRGPLRVGAK
jgi:lipoprotein-anchoring transpeptidase ErfK/SrfK